MRAFLHCSSTEVPPKFRKVPLWLPTLFRRAHRPTRHYSLPTTFSAEISASLLASFNFPPAIRHHTSSCGSLGEKRNIGRHLPASCGTFQSNHSRERLSPSAVSSVLTARECAQNHARQCKLRTAVSVSVMDGHPKTTRSGKHPGKACLSCIRAKRRCDQDNSRLPTLHRQGSCLPIFDRTPVARQPVGSQAQTQTPRTAAEAMHPFRRLQPPPDRPIFRPHRIRRARFPLVCPGKALAGNLRALDPLPSLRCCC